MRLFMHMSVDEQTMFLREFVKLFGFNSLTDYTTTFTAHLLTSEEASSLLTAITDRVDDLAQHFNSRDMNLDKLKHKNPKTPTEKPAERALGILKKCLDAAFIPYEIFRKNNLSSMRLIPIKNIVMSYIRQMDNAYVIRHADEDETVRARLIWENAPKEGNGLDQVVPVEPLLVWIDTREPDCFKFQVTQTQTIIKNNPGPLSEQFDIDLTELFSLNATNRIIAIDGVESGMIRTNYYRETDDFSCRNCYLISEPEQIVLHRRNDASLNTECMLKNFKGGPVINVNDTTLDTSKCYVDMGFNHAVYELEVLEGNEYVEGFHLVGLPNDAVSWARTGNVFRPVISADFNVESSLEGFLITDEQKTHCLNFSRIPYIYAVLKPGLTTPLKIVARNYNVVTVSKYKDYNMASIKYG